MLKAGFIVISIILALLIALYKVYVSRLKRTPKISVFVSVIAGTLLLYIMTAILLAIFIPNIWSKVMALLLAFSPFIIGKLAVFKTENFYSWFQVTIITLGVAYFILI